MVILDKVCYMYKKKLFIGLGVICFLTGCAGAPTFQKMAFVTYSEENIEFIENNNDATVKWLYKIDPAKKPIKKSETKKESLSGLPYIIDSAPIVCENSLLIFKSGSMLELNPITSEITKRINLIKDLKMNAVLDRYVPDPDGKVFSFAYNRGMSKYVFVKNDNDVLIQKHGGANTGRQFLEYHKGRIIQRPEFAKTVAALDAFTGKIIWIQPVSNSGGRAGIKENIRKGVGPKKDYEYADIRDVVFDRQNELICVLYQTRQNNFYIEAYNFSDGTVKWAKRITPRYEGNNSKVIFTKYENKILLIEKKKAWREGELSSSLNRIYEIQNGNEIGEFEGIINLANKVDKGVLFFEKDSGIPHVFDFDVKNKKKMKIELQDNLSFVRQVENKYLVFKPMISDRTVRQIREDEHVFYASRYGKVICVDKDSYVVLWESKIESQPARPTVYEDDKLIVIGDPLGNGLSSHMAIISEENLASQAAIINIENGKNILKAKVNDGMIARIAVLNNMAFIKTLKGNMFALKWDQK